MKESIEIRQKNPERQTSFPERPLGALSNFVVEEMPSMLAGVRAGELDISLVSNRARSLLRDLPAGVLTREVKNDLARLDLKMLEVGIVHSGGIVPIVLMQVVDRFSQAAGVPSGILYEEVILINPVSDRRTFTTGDPGKSEADFYERHRRIEGHLDRGINLIHHAISSVIITRKTAEASGLLRRVSVELDKVNGYMEDVAMKMPKEHFAEFRRYFGSHSGRNLKGPSGAFTAGIPTLDLLVGGENLPEEFHNYISDNIMYFPRKGRKELRKAIDLVKERFSLTSLNSRLSSSPTELTEPIAKIAGQLKMFRGKHYRGVKHQIPGAVEGKVEGSGGEHDPGTFLRARMRMRHIKEDDE